MSAYKTWKTYGSGPRVDSRISQARRDEIQRHDEEVRQDRELLKNLTQAVLYLSRQEFAFRGHDESNDSLNRGNYRELLERFARMDSVFERQLHVYPLMRRLMYPPAKEQLSMIVRLDKMGDIIERQLGFVDFSSERTATALSTVIKGKLIQHENIMDKLIGQTYDGASVMSGHDGHLNGVQAQIQR
ncbi:Hypothetical predicted protein, partial [Paramuricea clavata]